MSTNDNKKDILLSTLLAADAVVTSVAGAKLFQNLAGKVAKNGLDLAKVKNVGAGVGMGICSGILLAGDFVPALAQVIDRVWAKKDAAKEEESCEEIVEEIVEEPVEEAVEAVVEEVVEAPVEEPAVETIAPVADAAVSEEEDEDETFGFSTAGLEFFDAMEKPEEYAALQEQEKEGLIQIVTRYRRSFMSRLVQSQGEVQEYYSEIKNKLLSYKGVKSRISWGNESFNKGRNYIAKVNAKSKTLYLYLALDPATLEEGTYNFEDMSAKKKYENVPVLIKIKGPRKLKYALELIDKICQENLALPEVKNFEPTDYTVPYWTTEELVKTGLVKKMVAGMPVQEFDTSIAPTETEVDVTLA
ncbi:MAG: hypothetical protein E7584_06780 [Ruminococcaceae bacterium]|nr:hypothetical protein [Oscillospiraceae bacterium]